MAWAERHKYLIPTGTSAAGRPHAGPTTDRSEQCTDSKRLCGVARASRRCDGRIVPGGGGEAEVADFVETEQQPGVGARGGCRCAAAVREGAPGGAEERFRGLLEA